MPFVGGGGRAPKGKYHLKFPFWLFEPLSYANTYQKIISKIMQTFSSHICTTAWIVLSNNFGTPPLYFQMFIFLAILLPCSTAHHVLFLHNFGTKSHLYQLFPLVEELLERYGFTAIFKNGIDINIVLLYSSNGHDYLYYCKTIFCQKLGQDFETKWNVAKVFNEMFKCLVFRGRAHIT